MRFFSVFLLIFLHILSFSQELDYQDWIVKDYEEMRKIIIQHIQDSRGKKTLGDSSSSSQVKSLKDGLRILFARPDNDNVSHGLISLLKGEIKKHSKFLNIVDELATESVSVMTQKTGSVKNQASHLFVLEHIIAQLKVASTGSEQVDVILNKIYKAKIKISKGIISQRNLDLGMGKTISPSKLAKSILDFRNKRKKKIQKEKEKAKKLKEERDKKRKKQKSELKKHKSKKELSYEYEDEDEFEDDDE